MQNRWDLLETPTSAKVGDQLSGLLGVELLGCPRPHRRFGRGLFGRSLREMVDAPFKDSIDQ